MSPSATPGPAALAAAAMLAGAVTAHAQDPASDSAHTLPALEIISSVLPTAGATPGSGNPARTVIVDAAALRRRSPRTLAESMAGIGGIALYDDLGSAWKPTIVMRGFTTSGVVGLPQGVTVFIDGVPVNEPDAGQVNFDLLPLRHARQVEVFSGTASLLGPNSLAGAINLVTNRGGGPARGDLSVMYGSHGRRALSATAEGRARGWNIYVGGEVAEEGGWRQLTGATMANALFNVGRFGSERGIGFQLSVASSRAETAGSLPVSVYGVRPDSNLSSGDFEDLRQLHVAMNGYATVARGQASFSAYVRAHDAERFNVNQVDDPDVRGFSENRTAGLHGQWARTFTQGSGTTTIRAGAGGSINRAAIQLFGERIDPGLTTDVESPIRKGDAFLLGNHMRGRVTLSGGARVDVVTIPFRNLLRPDRDTTSTYTRLSPRLGLGFDVGGGTTLFASAGRSFRAPAVIELACADPEEPCPLPFALGDDPPLAPVVATTFEAGARWARGGFAMDATAYRTNVQDDIFLFPYEDESEPEGSTIDGYFANIPRTRREGVELSAAAASASGHRLHLGWSLSRATFQSEAELFSTREAAGEENDVQAGDRLPLVPEQTFVVGTHLQVAPAITVGGELRYVGRRWLRGDEANVTTPLPSHTLLDLSAAVERGRWALDLTVTNALATQYAAFGTFNINQGGGDVLERFLTPGQRRSVQLSLRRAFGSTH